MHSDNIGIKRNIVKKDSSILWYKRLAHISLKRIKRLVNDGILKNINFTNFGICLGCTKRN